MIQAIAHLVDDASFGGINRMLDHVSTDPKMSAFAEHRIVRLRRGQLSAPELKADVIVSHLSINWRNLPLLTLLRGRYPDSAFIHVEHSYSERFIAANVENRDRFETLIRSTYALFDTVVAVSKAQGEWIARRRFCAPSRVRIIPPCVKLDAYFAVPSKTTNAALTIAAIGRFDTQKGFDTLIMGFRAAGRPDMKLHLFGDGPQRGDLEALAAGDPFIAFKGYAADTAAALAASDVVAMPSRWEPYGLVALEAMAARRPVLCARVDGLSDHIANGAIDIGGNSADGWRDALRTLSGEGPDFDYRGLAAALNAERNFAEAWRDLVTGSIGANADFALAA